MLSLLFAVLTFQLIVATILLALSVVFILREPDVRRALASFPVVVINLIVQATGVLALPGLLLEKVAGALDAFSVERWSMTAKNLAESRVPVEIRAKACDQLWEKVLKAHRVGPFTPAKVEPLVKPVSPGEAKEILQRAKAEA